MWFRHHEKKPVNEYWNNYYLKTYNIPYPNYDPTKTQWISSKWHWLASDKDNRYISTCGFLALTVQLEDDARKIKTDRCGNCKNFVKLLGV